MNGGKKPLGYTIVEVMVVLAVSGTMFLIASTFISGKQAKTAFTQGTNEMASRLQDTIEQVTDGQYSDVPINCSFTQGTPAGTTNPNLSGSTPQGQNNQCVFLGKLLHFEQDNDKTKYEVFSMAGGRATDTDKPITQLAYADPKVVDLLTAPQSVPQHLDISKITVSNDSGGADEQSLIVGFFQGQGSLNVDLSVQNGAQAVSIYYVSGAIDPVTTNKNLIKDHLVRAKKIQICVTDGTRYAVVAVGDISGQLSVNTTIYGATVPALC